MSTYIIGIFDLPFRIYGLLTELDLIKLCKDRFCVIFAFGPIFTL